MKTELLKEMTNEELLGEMENAFQQMNHTKIFSAEHRECHTVVRLIKEELLKRLNSQ